MAPTAATARAGMEAAFMKPAPGAEAAAEGAAEPAAVPEAPAEVGLEATEEAAPDAEAALEEAEEAAPPEAEAAEVAEPEAEPEGAAEPLVWEAPPAPPAPPAPVWEAPVAPAEPAIEVAVALRQSEEEPAWMTMGEEYWTAPVPSRTWRETLVPASRLTFQVYSVLCEFSTRVSMGWAETWPAGMTVLGVSGLRSREGVGGGSRGRSSECRFGEGCGNVVRKARGRPRKVH